MENDIKYYNYYLGKLKQCNMTEEQIQLGIETQFNVKASLMDLGRFINFKCVSIKADDFTAYAVPLETPEEICNRTGCNQSLGESLIAKQAFILPYVAGDLSYKLVFSATAEEEMNQVFLEAYPLGYYANRIKNNYHLVPEFNSYIQFIQEAIESFCVQHYTSAILLLLSVIDGVSRTYCTNHQLSFQKNGATDAFKQILKKRKRDYMETIVLRENGVLSLLPEEYYNDQFMRRIDEGMDMLCSFEEFGIEYLYKSKCEISPNRHNFAHGIGLEMCNKLNFYKIYACLEMLFFAITLNPFYKGIGSEGAQEYKSLLQRFISMQDFSVFLNHIKEQPND